MSCALVTRIAFGKCPLKLEAKTALPIRGCPNVMRVTSFNPKLTYKNIECRCMIYIFLMPVSMFLEGFHISTEKERERML